MSMLVNLNSFPLYSRRSHFPIFHVPISFCCRCFSLPFAYLSSEKKKKSRNFSKSCFIPCWGSSNPSPSASSLFFSAQKKMSEFSLASTPIAKKKTQFSTLLISDFILFCSFLLSQPLYFSYFIFFSPYLFKIFSFLSPLFVTTSLLVLAFFTRTPSSVNQAGSGSGLSCHPELPEPNASFPLTTYHSLVETLRSEVGDYGSDGFGCLEELEVLKIVFETSTMLEIRENPSEVLAMEDKNDCLQAVELEASVDKGVVGVPPETLTSDSLDEKSVEITRPETIQVKAVVKIFEDLLHEKEGVENSSSKKREKEVKSSLIIESDKGDGQKEEEFMRSASDPKPKVNGDNNDEEFAAKIMVNSQRSVKANYGDYNYQTTGSMRKEKEWKRTLACKLFEERNNMNIVDNNGGEGMDLLWEAYETESESIKVKLKSGSKKGKIKGGNNNKKYCDHDDEDDEDDDCEEGSDGQLCCLQALKFSAGKMNLGMGRPNLVKISKALKGFGWLHHVSSSRHGKKGYQ